MQIHSDAALEAWGNVFVKNRVFTLTKTRFEAFIAASDERKRDYINAAIAKRNQLTQTNH